MIKINRDNNSIIPIEVDRHTVQGAGPASFHIHGTLHHLMGTLIPLDNHQPSYAQLYIYDPQEATNTHFQRNPDLQRDILLDLHQLLTEHHPYALLYQQAYEVMRAKPPEQHTDVCMCLHFQQGDDGRRYNLPTVDEIAAIVPDDGSESVRVEETSYYAFKVVVFITSVTFIPPIFHSTMFYCSQMDKRAGI